jgi:hypothetical protein
LTELKRRNVYPAAVAYGVVAWFLTQLTTQVFPFFEIPNSAVRFVVIALAVGFPNRDATRLGLRIYSLDVIGVFWSPYSSCSGDSSAIQCPVFPSNQTLRTI